MRSFILALLAAFLLASGAFIALSLVQTSSDVKFQTEGCALVGVAALRFSPPDPLTRAAPALRRDRARARPRGTRGARRRGCRTCGRRHRPKA